MKWKNLLPLIVILAILVALVVVKQKQQKPVTIVEQVQLTSLLPEGLKPADLAKLELFAGGTPDEKVVLVRSAEDGEKWAVSTHFDAPVSEEKIDEYLSMLVKLKGEFRAAAESDEDLNLYDLGEDKAFHVTGYRKDGEEAAFHVLVGKSADHKTIFMRTADSRDVFVEQKNPRSDAGVWGDEMDKAPEPGVWLDKKITEIEKDDIVKLAINTPEKRLLFEKREKEKASEEGVPEEGEPAAGEGETESEEADKEEKPEYEWVLVEGGPGSELKMSALVALLGAFNPLNATDVVDPAKKEEWGLDKPAFTCVITVKGEKEDDEPKDVILEGGRPDPSADGYMRVAGGDKDIAYKLNSYSFERIFPKGTTFFDLPKLSATEKSIDRVELTQPEGNVVLARINDVWTVEQPKADLEVAKTKVDAIARTLAGLKASDYSDKADGAGLDAPARTVRFTEGPEKSYVVTVGAEAKGIDGAYAKLPNSDVVAVISKSDLDKVFVSPKDLYERTLLDINEDDIATIKVERDTDAFMLAREEGGDPGWGLAVGDVRSDTDGDAADSLVAALVELQADDILFGTPELPGITPAPTEPTPEGGEAPAAPTPAANVYATVRVATNAGDEHVLLIGPEKDGAYPVKLVGKAPVVSVPSIDIAEILPASESLKKQEPAPEETADKEAADGAAAETAPTQAPEEDAGVGQSEAKAESTPEPAVAAPAQEAAPAPAEQPKEEPAPEPAAAAPAQEAAPAPAGQPKKEPAPEG